MIDIVYINEKTGAEFPKWYFIAESNRSCLIETFKDVFSGKYILSDTTGDSLFFGKDKMTIKGKLNLFGEPEEDMVEGYKFKIKKINDFVKIKKFVDDNKIGKIINHTIYILDKGVIIKKMRSTCDFKDVLNFLVAYNGGEN
ncbi:MAG: hypothetical protein ACRCX2_24215 [Paraclostridium sp.]